MKFRLHNRVDNWSWEHFKMPFKLKYFKQRVTRGWAVSDAWSIDNYVTHILIGGLKQLQENKHGIPCAPYDSEHNEVYVIEGWPPEAEGEFDRKAKLWDELLVQIIDALETYVKLMDLDEEFDTKEKRDVAREKIEAGLLVLVYNWGSFWD